MHRIEETPYGYRIYFDGFLLRDDAGDLLLRMREMVRPRAGGFQVLVDLRHSRAFPAESQEVLKEAIQHCKETGMERNAVVLNSAIATLQARRLGKETGIDRWARYIDASRPGWEKVALEWLVDAKDPGESH